MAFIIKLKGLDKASLLDEKKHLERIIDNIFLLNLKSNGKDVQKKCNVEQVAHALYFIIVIKYLGRENQTLTKTNNFNVAVKIVVNNEKLFEQSLEMVYSQLIAIDPKEDFLERLALLFKSDSRNDIDYKIQLFKKQKLEIKNKQDTPACVQSTPSDTDNPNCPKNLNNQTVQVEQTDQYTNLLIEQNIEKFLDDAEQEEEQKIIAQEVKQRFKDFKQKCACDLKQHLHLPFQFNEDFTSIEINRSAWSYTLVLKNIFIENQDAELSKKFFTLKILAMVLAYLYNEIHADLLDLTFEEFCNVPPPMSGVNYQDTCSLKNLKKYSQETHNTYHLSYNFKVEQVPDQKEINYNNNFLFK